MRTVHRLPAGVLLRENRSPVDEVLVCGGMACQPRRGCQNSAVCYRYNPQADAWTQDADLLDTRWGHHFEYLPDANSPNDADAPEVPVIYGTDQICEVYDTATG